MLGSTKCNNKNLDKQDRHKIYVTQVIARYKYIKHEGYHKESKLGYRDNRGTRRRRCIPVLPNTRWGTSRWRDAGYHEGLPNATKAHLLLQANTTKDKGLSLMASFSSTPEMASSTTTSQAPWRRRSGLFTIFHEEITEAPTAKPTRR